MRQDVLIDVVLILLSLIISLIIKAFIFIHIPDFPLFVFLTNGTICFIHLDVLLLVNLHLHHTQL